MNKFVGCVVVSGFAAASHAALLIDNFTGLQTLNVTGTGTVSSNGMVTAGAIGGVRRLLGINDVNPLNGTTMIQVDGGLATISSGPRVDPRVEFGYGANTVGSLVDMNANFTVGNDRIRIAFDSNDQDLMLRIRMRSTSGTGGAWLTAYSRFVAGGRATTAFNEDFLFSSILINPITLTDVDNMIVQFDTTAGGDVSLRNMSAVPEPATMTALALGAVALLRRRRK